LQLVLNASGVLHRDVRKVRYTNPADQNIELEYLLEDKSSVMVELYDLNGYRLYQLTAQDLAKGIHQQSIDVSHVHPGFYLLAITTAQGRQTMGISISR
jgi:hypothetical protein